MDDDLRQQWEQAHDRFYTQYGAAMAAWSRLELALSYWFHSIAGTNNLKSAEAIFYSGRSYQTRRDMLAAALATANLDEHTHTFLTAAFKKAARYSEARNHIAHRLFMSYDDKIDLFLQHPPHWDSPDVHTVSDLAEMAKNFDALGVLLMRARQNRTHRGLPPLTLQEALAQVRALPNQAFPDRSSPT
jgi:hypothetical protein